MRKDTEVLTTCPTCATPVAKAENIGLRDFRWLNDVLPGREGAMDIDGVIEKRGNVLMFEFKPIGAKLSVGSLITFKALIKKGIDVMVVWGPDKKGTFQWGFMNRRGEVPDIWTGDRSALEDEILDWREEAEAS